MSPSSSRSCITLRTEAGDSDIGSMRDKCREPTGSPEERYESTMLRKISRDRALSVVNALDSGGRSVGADMQQAWLELANMPRKCDGKASSGFGRDFAIGRTDSHRPARRAGGRAGLLRSRRIL